MISELRRTFEIGFLIIMPFLVIDMVVATLTMSMGMMMMPPTVFALPFKVLFFVLIDGWNLLTVGLMRSFLQAVRASRVPGVERDDRRSGLGKVRMLRRDHDRLGPPPLDPKA